MKIAIIQGAFLPVPAVLGGAVEKMWYQMGKTFAQKGHEVIHICKKHKNMPLNEYVDGIQYIRVRGYQTTSSLFLLKILDFLYTISAIRQLPKDADVIITNTFWFPILLSGPLRKKIYVDVQRFPKGQMQFYKDAFRLRACSTTIFEAIKKELPAHLHAKVSIIPNPLPFIPLSTPSSIQKQNTILFVGRIHPEKGLELLINAYKDSDQLYPLLIIGPSDVKNGGGGDKYLQKLKQIAGNANIEFVGPIFDEKLLFSFYAKASIFIYPSIAEHGEALPIAPLEAMSWGCVPIVSNLSCFRDFIRSDSNGLVFDHRAANAIHQLTEQIQKLQDNPLLRAQLSEEALKIRQSHSPETISELFIKDFSNIPK